MTIQTINLGTAPSGAGGDTFRSTGTKVNENFTNNTHAASRYVGTANGNLMEFGAFGFGALSSPDYNGNWGNNISESRNSISKSGNAVVLLMKAMSNQAVQLIYPCGIANTVPQYAATKANGSYGQAYSFLTQENTIVDSNGFVKAASPIIKLFAEKIEPNEEALEQEPVFEKMNVGHYLLKNTEGFSDDGWYIEMPKDANGNVLVAVQYQQLEDNTIEVKTFAKKFDEETGDILPNLEKPRDIPVDRWIDIRLKALQQPEIEISNTPPDFQPTNLAQAVAEALKNDTEQ